MSLEEAGQPSDALIVCRFGVDADYVLVDNPTYPSIADDYRATCARARELPVDVFLASHGFFGPNPFIDRERYLEYVRLEELRFLGILAAQQAAVGQ